MIFSRTVLSTALFFVLAAPVLADNDKLIFQQNRHEYITHEQARDTAIQRVGGGMVDYDDVDFEYDKLHGAHFEVEVTDLNGKQWDVKIDAKTGKVIDAREEW